MPKIRPISDLRNNSSEIAEFCKSSHEPIYITKNGIGELVVMSMDMYEQLQARIELYSKLSETEENIANGDQGIELSEFANQLRSKVHGAI